MAADETSRSTQVEDHLHRVVHCPHLVERQVADMGSQSPPIDGANHLA